MGRDGKRVAGAAGVEVGAVAGKGGPEGGGGREGLVD